MMRSMKKIILMALTTLLLMAGSLKAQVFITDDEFEGVLRHGESEYILVAPTQGTNADQYLPLGDGLYVLGAFAASYLLAKRKKRQ